jgi:hypothetical protein
LSKRKRRTEPSWQPQASSEPHKAIPLISPPPTGCVRVRRQLWADRVVVPSPWGSSARLHSCNCPSSPALTRPPPHSLTAIPVTGCSACCVSSVATCSRRGCRLPLDGLERPAPLDPLAGRELPPMAGRADGEPRLRECAALAFATPSPLTAGENEAVTGPPAAGAVVLPAEILGRGVRLRSLSGGVGSREAFCEALCDPAREPPCDESAHGTIVVSAMRRPAAAAAPLVGMGTGGGVVNSQDARCGRSAKPPAAAPRACGRPTACGGDAAFRLLSSGFKPASTKASEARSLRSSAPVSCFIESLSAASDAC